MGNIRLVVTNQLTIENYPHWRSQIGKLFSANGFDEYLNESTTKPLQHSISSNGIVSNPNYNVRVLIDQNLVVALYSTISTSLLSYILNMDLWSDN